MLQDGGHHESCQALPGQYLIDIYLFVTNGHVFSGITACLASFHPYNKYLDRITLKFGSFHNSCCTCTRILSSHFYFNFIPALSLLAEWLSHFYFNYLLVYKHIVIKKWLCVQLVWFFHRYSQSPYSRASWRMSSLLNSQGSSFFNIIWESFNVLGYMCVVLYGVSKPTTLFFLI